MWPREIGPAQDHVPGFSADLPAVSCPVSLWVTLTGSAMVPKLALFSAQASCLVPRCIGSPFPADEFPFEAICLRENLF